MVEDYVENWKKEIENDTAIVLKKLKDNRNYKLIEGYKNHLLNSTSGSTVATYVYHLERFCNFIGNKSLKDVDSNDLNSFIGKLKRDDKKSTARLSYATLLGFYRYFEKLNKKEYPKRFREVEAPKPVEKETEPLDYKEVQKLINCWHDSIRNKAITHVLYESMMRKTEFLALRVGDINLEKKPAKIKVRISKTEKGKNRPAFLYNSIPILKEWLNIHPLKDTDNFDEVPLFVSRKGEAFQEGMLRLMLKEASCRVFGFTTTKGKGDRKYKQPKKKIYPHLFRHSRAYELAQMYHFSPQELMKMGGWRKSTMLDTYYNPKESDIKNKILNGHGIVTVSQKEKEEALKNRNIRLCACGYENSYDTIFCKKCGIILNIKGYQKEMKSKDSELEKLKEQQESTESALKEMKEMIMKLSLEKANERIK